ncbi:lipase [Holotrichia oblita]|uniref:Lipase n=1 Tax=Holotrichia oblita TaxID=644536 RepID=A0ACB9T6J8_HOLOL|nr:lipase [Holotrichia oblita]
MHLLSHVLIISILILNSSGVELKNGRRYDPQEEQITSDEYMIITDGNGIPHLQHLQQDVRDVEINVADIKLYLHTNENQQGEVLSIDNLNDLLSSNYYDPSIKNIFTIHGWISTIYSDVNTQTKDAIFESNTSANIFVIDWSIPAGQFYTLAVWAIRPVSQIITNYIDQMIDRFGIAPSDFTLIGHSLGAHLAGSIGANLNGSVAQIVGLDPALPLFTLNDTDTRLDETDARTVHVIHTNGGYQGFDSSIGDADFFFNGGVKQAGCGPDIMGSCSHARATHYYSESILCSRFKAVECSSYEAYQSGGCSGNREVIFGGYPLDESISGDFYLDTAETSPFALG